jgi:hypothetical protein
MDVLHCVGPRNILRLSNLAVLDHCLAQTRQGNFTSYTLRVTVKEKRFSASAPTESRALLFEDRTF